jgi:hypothetical protein
MVIIVHKANNVSPMFETIPFTLKFNIEAQIIWFQRCPMISIFKPKIESMWVTSIIEEI